MVIYRNVMKNVARACEENHLLQVWFRRVEPGPTV